MTEQTAVEQLLAKVWEKTESKALDWVREGSNNDTFATALPSGSVLKMFSFTAIDESGNQEGPPSLTLYEGEDMVLDITNREFEVTADKMRALYDLIQRTADRTNERIEALISELSSLPTRKDENE